MTKILVLADDFTGAAEIGGLAFQFGLSVRFVLEPRDGYRFTEDVVVIDTDSRNSSGRDAFEEVGKRLSQNILARVDLIFKKTDSVLRGPVESEIRVILQKSDVTSCLLVPANPSKGRVIKDGYYHLDGIPIHKTDFANDPQYPRTDSNVLKMIVDQAEIEYNNDLSLLDQKNRIIIPDIPSLEAIDSIVRKVSGKSCLFAGGADLFRALLSIKLGLTEKSSYRYDPTDGKQHFIIGSRSKSSTKTIALLLDAGYAHFPLREENIKTKGHQLLLKGKIKKVIKNGYQVVISRPENEIREISSIRRLAEGLAVAATFLVDAASPNDEIGMEGGETARAVLNKTNNTHLTITSVLADGVVKLRSKDHGIHFVVKPGSYPWPDVIFKRIRG